MDRAVDRVGGGGRQAHGEVGLSGWPRVAKFRRDVALTQVDKMLPLKVQDTPFFPRISDGVRSRARSTGCYLIHNKK